ncbi:MAG TPA: DUF1559 domain-containing protein, partial [Planctomycetaceae bacterium]|nr:DUF1559 domain-containing protein [Planctomycetaceae bacterium]
YNSTSKSRSWLVAILPYIDQAPLFNQVNFSVPLALTAANPLPTTDYTVNTPIAIMSLPAFLCASDSTNGGGKLINRANIENIGAMGVTNYKAVAGGNWAWGTFPYTHPTGRNQGSNNGLDAGNGWNCRTAANSSTNITRIRDLTDGTSNVLMVGEAAAGRCTHTQWWWFNGSTATCGVPLNYYVKNTAITAGDWPNNYSFGSMHTGGGHFLMGDGTVKFLSENIDLQMYRNLATINGNEAVGEF